MRSITKNSIQRTALLALGLIAASTAHAITFDEAVGLLGTKGVSALRAASPEVVQAIADVSQVASAWKAGRLATSDAVLAAAEAVRRLSDHWSDLRQVPPASGWAVHQVAVLVLASDVRSLMTAAEWRTDGPLSEAMVGWLDESTRMLPSLAPDGPGAKGCLEALADCMDSASYGRTVLERGRRGLACAWEFIQCTGSKMGGGLQRHDGEARGF